MKVSKTVLGVVIAGVLLVGWQIGSRAEEVAEAVKEAPVAEVPAPVVTPADATEAAPVSEAATPVTSAPAHATETVPATEAATPVTAAPANATEVTTPVIPAPAVTPAHTENKEESSKAMALSIAELYAKKAEINGKNVTISGKVVKVNLGVMGKNWIHIQDGTGTAGTNDITITTAEKANINDKVAVSGKVATDKDFGGGYKYSVIIEEATVKVQ